ncbi:MAG: NAD-dependent epimerase/dehydratase family protein [Notoacmeibacter sp.]|nr:NAD-dependent epimerase/dehydratase family protein [Notoacmeibacter sp.]
MRVVITGASGFVGNGLARHLCVQPDALGRPISRLVLADLGAAEASLAGHDIVEWRCGDLTDPAYLDLLLDEPVDCLFHLASLPGSLAEREPDLGWSVNLTAPFELARRLGRQGRLTGRPPRVVFASTIAVYGPLGPESASEYNVARPAISYGAHKLMTEILLADLSRRGEVDARSIRLPGIVARPATESGHGSAFMSLLFYKAATGEPYVCPVAQEATAWWMSLPCCVSNLVHAARLDSARLPARRVWQLPVLHARVGEVVEALGRRYGAGNVGQIAFEPNEAIESLFGRFPPIVTPEALAFGFMADADTDALVAMVMGD